MAHEHIRIGSLNVCGIKDKLNIPEFEQFIREYDIISIQETHLHEYDSVVFPGYTVMRNDRKQHKSTRIYGGICVLVKQSLLPRVTPVDTASQFVLFLNIAGLYIGNRRHCNALLGTVYIPPEGSLYTDGD